MILTDTHTHTLYSFDGAPESTVGAMCERAIELGIKYLCITDHYEANYRTQYPEYPVYNAKAAAKDIFECKEKYKSKLNLIYGIECGQITQATKSALEFLDENKFEFVIGSLHNTEGNIDPHDMDMGVFTKDELRALWDTYLEELLRVAKFDCFETLAHLTYPIRYCYRYNNIFDYTYSRDAIAEILKTVIDKNMCLEVNSSGYRQLMDSPLPNDWILKLYKDLGGELITIGSDAHKLEHMAFGFEQTQKYLKALGFEHYHLKTKKELITFDL